MTHPIYSITNAPNRQASLWDRSLWLQAALFLAVGLVMLKANFLLFHSFVETFAVVIAFALYFVSRNTRWLTKNDYFVFLGIAYMHIGILDFSHMLAYKGMGIFDISGPNHATQLWIAARFLEAAGLLVAPLLLTRKMHLPLVFSGFSAVTVLAICSIFIWGIFPDCYIETAARPLTTFKVVGEYVIVLMVAAALYAHSRKRKLIGSGIYTQLCLAMGFTIAAELAFTLYTDVYGITNALGHFFKAASFFLLYRALTKSTLVDPFNTLFGDLQSANHQLRAAEQQLRATNQQLTSSNLFLESVINSSPVAMWISDPSGTIINTNEALRNTLNLTDDQIIGKYNVLKDDNLDEQGVMDQVRAVFRDNEYARFSIPWKSLQAGDVDFSRGRDLWIDVSMFPIVDSRGQTVNVVCQWVDITERQRAEEEREKTSRLQSLGGLAAGIAHDFNNMLGGLFGYVDLARTLGKHDEKTARYLNKAMDRLEAAKELTHQLLTFAKGGDPVRSAVDLHKLVTEAIELSLAGSNIQAAVETIDEDLVIDADRGQLAQVLGNLLINAREAMPDGGEVQIVLRKHDGPPRGIEGLSDGPYVELAITDHGVGITPENLSKIFDPFFSTKAEGSGLGLATAYSIINKHGGHISVESKPGKGTSFHVFLPASLDSMEEPREPQNCAERGGK